MPRNNLIPFASRKATNSSIDREQALKQLKLLGYQDSDQVYLRFFYPADHPRKPGDLGRKKTGVYPILPWREIERYQADGRGCYFVVNGGGHKDADVTNGRAIFYEHDDLPKENQRDLWKHLGLPEPTLQIDTGGKSIHSYWVFEQPISIDQWKPLQADLLNHADADRSIKNPSRVMRLAGCCHASSGQQSEIISSSGQRYPYEQLRAAIPPPQPPQQQAISWAEFDRSFSLPWQGVIPLAACLSRRHRDLIECGAGQGGRNSSGAALARDLIGTAAHLRQIDQRFDGDPEQLFNDYCSRCSPAIDDSERAAIWKSAAAAAPGSTLSPEQIEGCIKGYAWGQKPTDAGGMDKNRFPSGNAARTHSKNNVIDHPTRGMGFDPARMKRSLTDLSTQGLSEAETELEKTRIANESGQTPQHIDKLYQAHEREQEQADEIADSASALSELNAIRASELPIEAGLHGDGGKLAQQLRLTAEAMPTAPEFLATTLIPMLASRIGTSSELVISATAKYSVPIIFRTLIVAKTGRKKTPAQKSILGVLQRLEAVHAESHQLELEQYEVELNHWEAVAKDQREAPIPKRPTRRRYLSTDDTLAARIQVHAENPRGLLLYRDEGSAFIAERGRFTSGRGDGGEAEADLSEFNGDAISRDRKGDGSVFLAKSAISRTGAIQYEKLKRLMGDHQDDCGEWARYLFCAAEAPPSYLDLTKDQGDIGLDKTLMSLIEQLDELPEQDYLLSDRAKLAFQKYQHELTDRAIKTDHPSLQSAFPKFETYFARFCLLLHIVNAALAKQQPAPIVSAQTVGLARQWTEYYIGQFKLLMATNSPQQQLTGDLLRLHDYLKRRPDRTVRQLVAARIFDSEPDKTKRKTPYMRGLLNALVDQKWAITEGDQYSAMAPPVEPPTATEPAAEPAPTPALLTAPPEPPATANPYKTNWQVVITNAPAEAGAEAPPAGTEGWISDDSKRDANGKVLYAIAVPQPGGETKYYRNIPADCLRPVYEPVAIGGN